MSGDPIRVAAGRWRVFLELAGELGSSAWSARDFPNRVQRVLASRRQLGSRDRRVQRELMFARCRAEPWASRADAARPGSGLLLAVLLSDCELALAQAGGLGHDFVARFRKADWPARIALLREQFPPGDFCSEDLAPAWFREECAEWREVVSPDLVWRRPPVWLRIRRGQERTVLEDLARAGAACEPSGVLDGAWRTDARIDLSRTTSFARGLLEVQDLGSQMLLAIAAPQPGTRWLDACAGAGGKTLQLADLVGPTGAIDAEDPRAAALGELRTRASRAGIDIASMRVVNESPSEWAPAREYDGVLVDAPCSGAGTWRRHPHLRLSTTAEDVKAAARTQLALLSSRSRAVRKGGLLVYATCSLCRTENAAVVESFLKLYPNFKDETPGSSGPGPGRTILPGAHDTDGFFAAVLRRG